MSSTLQLLLAFFSELSIISAALLALVFRAREAPREWTIRATFCALFAAWLGTFVAPLVKLPSGAFSMFIHNDLTGLCITLSLLGTGSVMALSMRTCAHDQQLHVTFATYLFALLGILWMLTSQHLMMTVIGLELVAICTLQLQQGKMSGSETLEVGYLIYIISAVGTAFLLMGAAFLYGACGSLSFDVIAKSAISPTQLPFFGIGVTFFLAGFAAKVGLVPFHIWLPPLQETAPTPVSVFLLIGPNLAILATFSRWVLGALDPGASNWFDMLLAGLCAGTMLWGNLAAMGQRSLKRMLAYLSIGHTGLLLLALTARSTWSMPAILFHLFALALTYLGIYAVLLAFEREGEPLNIEHCAGLAERYPVLSFALSFFLLSLAGLPPTLGWMSKWFVIGSAFLTGGSLMLGLACCAALASLLAIYTSIRIIYFIYMLPQHNQTATISEARPMEQKLVTVLCVAVVLLGLLPPLRRFQRTQIHPPSHRLQLRSFRRQHTHTTKAPKQAPTQKRAPSTKRQ